MSPIFYEDSLGAKLAEKIGDALSAPGSADDEFVDDPVALAQAEAAARAVDPTTDYDQVTEDWVTVFGPSKLSGMMDSAGFNARLTTAPLDAEGIPYVWDPYPPEEMPSYRVGYGAVDRPFSLLVPSSREHAARLLLHTEVGSPGLVGTPARPERSDESLRTRRRWIALFFLVFIGFDIVIAAVMFVLAKLGII